VVGGVRSASVGAGSMVTTMAATVTESCAATKGKVSQATKDTVDSAKERLLLMGGYTPEYHARLASDEEAWRQVLSGDSSAYGGARPGAELTVPARQALTSSFFVKAGSVLSWRFRVASHDVGFALRLRVQGDGGATEVDVFAMQRYAAGVTVQGEWSPSLDSALIVVWDNAYSYLREKTVAFQAAVVQKTAADRAAEDRAAAEAAAAPPPPPPPPTAHPIGPANTEQEAPPKPAEETVETVEPAVVGQAPVAALAEDTAEPAPVAAAAAVEAASTGEEAPTEAGESVSEE